MIPGSLVYGSRRYWMEYHRYKRKLTGKYKQFYYVIQEIVASPDPFVLPAAVTYVVPSAAIGSRRMGAYLIFCDIDGKEYIVVDDIFTIFARHHIKDYQRLLSEAIPVHINNFHFRIRERYKVRSSVL